MASAAAPAAEEVILPTAKAINAAGDREIAKHKGKPSELAASIFQQRRLAGEEFDEKQAEAYKHNGEEGLIKEQIVDPADLRKIFLEDLNDEVGSKDLFALVQAADPDGDGWVQLDAFIDVVEIRREQLEKIKAEALVREAYIALGGDADRSRGVKSDLLRAVSSDFVGKTATETAMAAVVAYKMKAVEEVLGAGGQLDDEEMDELKDVSKLSFEELHAFANSLHTSGADPAGEDE